MHQDKETPPFQKVYLMLAGAVLAVFSAAVLIGIFLVRTEIREQILQRDGVLLTSVAQYLFEEQDPSGIPDWDLFELALASSKIEGIIAVRAYSPLTELVGQVPETLYSVRLSSSDRETLRAGTPVIRYFPEFRLDTLFSDIEEIGESGTPPLIEVIAPLTGAGGKVTGSIQYWLDGETVAAEFSRLDRYLLLMGAAFILGGGVIFSIVFLYARNRLVGMARLLAERNRSLKKANADLMLAARTSAIGSITSHLFHGLKNPLAGLKAYLKVSEHDEEALAITDRMQSLINETLQIISRENGQFDSELSFLEFQTMAGNRLESIASDVSGPVRISARGEARIGSRQSQLILLILRNLVENAVEASPPGKPVDINMQTDETVLRITVSDKGTGLPLSVKDRLFEPVTSSKTSGTGIGLAISAVLARHIPASLKLARSDETGTEFILEMPL